MHWQNPHPGRALHRLTRRAAIRAAALPAAALVTVGLGACGPAAVPVRPVTVKPKTVVTFSPVPWGAPQERQDLYAAVLKPFLDKNPGIDVRLTFQARGNLSATSAAIVAGTAVDVFEDFQIGPSLMEGGYLLDLSPYLSAANEDLSIFPPTQLGYWNLNGHQYAMPVSIESMVTAVNTGAIRALGLTPPSDTWDYQDAGTLFQNAARITGSASSHRYGGSFYLYGSLAYPETFYLQQFGGSYVRRSDLASCNLASRGSVSAGEYIYPLLQKGICTTNWASGKLFNAGNLVVTLAGTWMLPQFAMIPPSIEWEFLPMPRGPVESATFGSPAFYGIPSTTKVADAAWALLEWMSFTPYLQTANMKFGLLPPASLRLYPDWVTVVESAAPPLRGKNLQAFTAATAHIIDSYFEYDTTQAFSLINHWAMQVLHQGVSVKAGFTQATQQVNALEARAAGAAALSSTSK